MITKYIGWECGIEYRPKFSRLQQEFSKCSTSAAADCNNCFKLTTFDTKSLIVETHCVHIFIKYSAILKLAEICC